MEGKASEKELQMKITQTWNRLPEHEQRHLAKMEEKQRILDLREIKVNIWKKWRREDEQTRNEVKKTHRENKEAWLNKLEHTLEQMQREVEEKRKAKLLYEEKRKKLLDENKKKQELILRNNQEKRERKERKKQLEEKWAMARWLTQYIDENTERWN